jgi:hypothetical protein
MKSISPEALIARNEKLLKLYGSLRNSPLVFPSISTKNGKLEPDRIACFSLPAVITCPGAGGCAKRGYCYAMHNRYAMDNVMVAHMRNFVASQRDEFHALMIDRLYALPRNIWAVRIHDGGDFYSTNYVHKWADLIAEFHAETGVKFYAYTKAFAAKDVDLSALRDLKGFHMIQSEGSLDDSLIDYSRPHARIFRTREEILEAGYEDASASDLPAAKGAIKIGLALHSNGKYFY